MKVAIDWLKELVDINVPLAELVKTINLKTIGTKEVTDTFIELDMKGYNRADLLSLRGVAREVAAVTDSQVKFTEDETDLGDNLSSKGDLKVEVRETNLTPFYGLVKIEGLKVEQSPKEWVKKLEDSGMRSVNNIADITNLVMLEFGQPMHAFDCAKVAGETIIVRTAQGDEALETLDGKKRILEPSDILITDPDKALGIAGVMGGKNSEITDATETILLEAAIFDPQNIRQTASRLGLTSEAGKRFYHGLTKRRLYQALNAAIKMYEDLGGAVTALSIQDNLNQKAKKINLTRKKTDSLIGVEIPEKDIEDYLTKLNFKMEKVDGGWLITPSYWRLDIDIEEDLIEEVARMYGYDRIPAKELTGQLPAQIDQKLFETIYKLKTTLVGEGLTEVQTYSFYSTDILKNLGFAPDHLNALVKIANPISSETEYMRMILWHNLLEAVVKNYKQGFEDMAIFEVGKIYTPKDGGVEEDYDLGIALMNGSDNPIEELFQILKNMLENLNLKLEMGDNKKDEFEEDEFHPYRFQHILINGQKSGKIAEVHPRVVNRFGLDKRVAILEIPLSSVIKK